MILTGQPNFTGPQYGQSLGDFQTAMRDWVVHRPQMGGLQQWIAHRPSPQNYGGLGQMMAQHRNWHPAMYLAQRNQGGM